MARRRSPRAWVRRKVVAGLSLAGLVFAPAPPLAAQPAAPAMDPFVVPSRAGYVGAWLATSAPLPEKGGSIDSAAPFDEATVAPVLGEVSVPSRGPRATEERWRIIATKSGALDLKEQLGKQGIPALGYLSGTLVARKAVQAFLLLGAGGAYRIWVDGKPIATRSTAGGYVVDGDELPLDLAAGKHRILLKVFRTGPDWSIRTRFVTTSLTRPDDLTIELPGLGAKDAIDLSGRLASVDFTRNLTTQGYAPTLGVRYSEGYVTSVDRGTPLAFRALGGPSPQRFDAGRVLADEGTIVHLPPIATDVPKTIEVSLADRVQRFDLSPRPRIQEALAACASVPRSSNGDVSLEWEASRLRSAVDHDERDGALLDREATALAALCRDAASGRDAFAQKTGPMRRAIVSPIDGEPSEFGLYVPPSYKPDATRKYPLIVALHGLNGKPMAMLRWFFGGDDEHKDQNWEDRHWDDASRLPSLDAFVIAPNAHGNAMYRGPGEDDVLRVLEWSKKTYRIDDRRVSITGPSMGGIGTAALAFHHPHLFSAAAPLCGYHSTFVRGDVMGKRLRPWEQFLAEERSNVFWAENGRELPLYIVHGKRDLPEANSGVLIERYEKLGFSVKHEHPDLGHNVWQKTYEGMKGAKWLLAHTRPELPRRVRFRSGRERYTTSYWLQIERFSSSGIWGELDATRKSESEVEVTSVRGIDAFRVGAEAFARFPITVSVRGAKVTFSQGEPIVLHREGETFHKGPPSASHSAAHGPIRDVWHDPLTFVYGTRNPGSAFANEQIAKTLAHGKYGFLVRYPVLSDVEFARTPLPDRSLVLIGRSSENAILAQLEASLPIKLEGEDVVLANGKRLRGPEVGAMFAYAHPQKPGRRIVVVEGVTPLGTYRALSLPDLIPDFVVYDRRIAAARDHTVLGSLPIRAAGFFKPDGSMPETVDEAPP